MYVGFLQSAYCAKCIIKSLEFKVKYRYMCLILIGERENKKIV